MFMLSVAEQIASKISNKMVMIFISYWRNFSFRNKASRGPLLQIVSQATINMNPGCNHLESQTGEESLVLLSLLDEDSVPHGQFQVLGFDSLCLSPFRML